MLLAVCFPQWKNKKKKLRNKSSPQKKYRTQIAQIFTNNKIQYKFLNNYIYLINYTSEFIKLEYFYFIPSLNKFTDDIDLPQYFKEIIKKFSIFYLNKDTKNDSFLLSELRTTIIDNMITRESADIDREIPFR